MVSVDLEQMMRVFDALLSNAIRYSDGKEVIVMIRQDQNGKPHDAVQDSGPGIAEEHQKLIFHPFYKIEPSLNGDDHRRLGIGLALAKEIIKAHGGEIWVKSRFGYGSTFQFTLPSPK